MSLPPNGHEVVVLTSSPESPVSAVPLRFSLRPALSPPLSLSLPQHSPSSPPSSQSTPSKMVPPASASALSGLLPCHAAPPLPISPAAGPATIVPPSSDSVSATARTSKLPPETPPCPHVSASVPQAVALATTAMAPHTPPERLFQQRVEPEELPPVKLHALLQVPPLPATKPEWPQPQPQPVLPRLEKPPTPTKQKPPTFIASRTYVHPLVIMPALALLAQKVAGDEDVIPLVFNCEAIIRQSHDGTMPTEFIRQRVSKRNRLSGNDGSDSDSSIECTDDDEDDDDDDEEDYDYDYDESCGSSVDSENNVYSADSDSFTSQPKSFAATRRIQSASSSHSPLDVVSGVSQPALQILLNKNPFDIGRRSDAGYDAPPTKKRKTVGARTGRNKEDYYDSDDSFIDDSEDFCGNVGLMRPRLTGYYISRGPVATMEIKIGSPGEEQDAAASRKQQRPPATEATSLSLSLTSNLPRSVSGSTNINSALSKVAITCGNGTVSASAKSTKAASVKPRVTPQVQGSSVQNGSRKNNTTNSIAPKLVARGEDMKPDTELSNRHLCALLAIKQDPLRNDIDNLDQYKDLLYEIFSAHLLAICDGPPMDALAEKIYPYLGCSKERLENYLSGSIANRFRKYHLVPNILKNKSQISELAKHTWDLWPGPSVSCPNDSSAVPRLKRYTIRLLPELRESIREYIQFSQLDIILRNWQSGAHGAAVPAKIDRKKIRLEKFVEIKNNFPEGYIKLQDIDRIIRDGKVAIEPPLKQEASATQSMESVSPGKVVKRVSPKNGVVSEGSSNVVVM